MQLPSEDQRRLYGDLAWTWPIISRKENYAKEAQEFDELIRQHSRIEPQTLLHLGCGGGHLDFTLKNAQAVTGVDLSEAMLSLARNLNPEVVYHAGDMRTVRLGKTFDAVIIADSIAYMLSGDDLRRAFLTAYVHLRPGGVFCTYAEFIRETFPQNKIECSVAAQGDVRIAFVENYYDPDPTDTTCEATFVYLIRREGRLEIETDRHLCGLFTLETWLALLQDVGFEIEQLEPAAMDQAPTFVCVKPSEQ